VYLKKESFLIYRIKGCNSSNHSGFGQTICVLLSCCTYYSWSRWVELVKGI